MIDKPTNMKQAMKKHIIPILMAVLLPLAVASCYSDDSSLGNPDNAKSIEISDIPAQAIISFAGNKLNITPEIETTYPESDLEYTWYLYVANSFESAGFRDIVIGNERELNYEVNLGSGTYVVVLEVKSKTTGYARYTRTTLNVSTEFSDGFYVLKETSDGKTELDMINANGVSGNLLTKLSGEPMKGSPISLGVLYMQQYVNPDNNEMEVTNMLNIFTDQDYRAYRTEDMKQTFDHSTICYAGESNDDVYYNISNGSSNGFLLSKKGISSKKMTGSTTLSTGKFALPAIEDDVTKHIQMLNNGRGGMAYWSNAIHGVRVVDAACTRTTDVTIDQTGEQQCLASGINRIAGTETSWFLAEDHSGKRYLHRVNNSGALVESTELDPSLHLAKATSVSGCGGSASYIYAVDNGKLYAYGWTNGTEIEVTLPGITEPIDYVTNQWFWAAFGDTSYNFDNLIVGAHDGNNYKLYFFNNLVGGIPTQEAYLTASGTGKVKTIRRVTPVQVSNMTITSPMQGRVMPIFPTSD